MPAAARIRPTDLFTPAEWADLSRRNDWIGMGLVVHAWAIVALAMAAAIWQPLLIPIAVMVIGARQLGLAILMHDAAHGGLHSNKRINDWVGQWLCAAPVGAHLGNYRPYHLQHHKFAQQPEDPDLNLSAPFPVTRGSLKRKIIRDLTGKTFLKQRSNQFANALGLNLRPGKGTQNRIQGAREAVLPFLLTNIVLFAGLTVLGHWWAYFILWLLPMATWNQLVTRLRNIAEHAVVPDNEDPMRHARTTLANPIEALLIAPYWVNYHCEHHMFMYLPCYRLGRAHRMLRKKGITEQMEVRQGYIGVLTQAASRPETLQPA
ncbi:MAG: fatty acid desaturase family protein [Pseudomonadota bacterium]